MAGLSVYPPTKGDALLRSTISNWIARRYDINAPDPDTQVLPALGSREALFAFAQAVIDPNRSEEHTSELQSLMRISYAVFCLKKKKNIHETNTTQLQSYPNNFTLVY